MSLHDAYVTTLVVAGRNKNADEFDALANRLGLAAHRAAWVQDGIARDYAHDAPLDIAALHGTLAGSGVDYATQRAEHRHKMLLVSDMDSTLIHQECIDELADFAGLKAHVAIITERAMNGELDFKAALRERVALLKGLPESVLQTAYDERIRLMEGAATLVATMKAQGAYALLVSGGFTFFTSRVRTALGFDEDQSNQLAIEEGMLTGAVYDPILDKDAKLAALNAACAARGITPQHTLAVGDGANDLPMILAAGLGVAYRAKPSVRAQASAVVTHGDLSTLLYFQGYATDKHIISS